MDEHERLKQMMRDEAARLGLGATGQYPHGSLGHDDEGELRVAITTLAGKIVIHLGKQVDWFALTPDGADALADLLRARAAAIREGR